MISRQKKKFKEINEANEILSHPENRKKYDKYGKDWKQAEEFEKSGYNPNQHQRAARHYQNSNSERDFSPFFQSMYGNGNSQRRTVSGFRGEELNANFLELSYLTKSE
jgi:curved DNA-binding protein